MFSDINYGRLQGKLHQDVCGQLRGDAEGLLDYKEDKNKDKVTNTNTKTTTLNKVPMKRRLFSGVGRQLPAEESCHSVHPSDGRKTI